MRTIKFFLLKIIILYSFILNAQDKTYNQKLGLVVKTDILSTAFSPSIWGIQSYSLSVEKFINKRWSLQLSGYYGFYDKKYLGESSHCRVFHIIPEYRFYLNKNDKHKGIYCGTYLEWWDLHIYDFGDGNEYKTNMKAVGVLSGYQFYFLKHFTIDFLTGIGAGMEYGRERSLDRPDGWDIPAKIGLSGRVALSIGYIFY